MPYVAPSLAKKRKYYVVWKGAKPGVYDTWPDANAQVAGFPGAKYKSFASRTQAEAAFRNGPSSKSTGTDRPIGASQRPRSWISSSRIIKPSLSVDAACSGNPGKMEYQGVSTATGQRLFHQAFPLGTNNIGEFLGIIHGLAWCQAQKLPDMPIYTDSKIAMGWVAKKKCKTTLKPSPRTDDLLDLIRRGEKWLKDNTYRNPILKWETKSWGEIPADFGRK